MRTRPYVFLLLCLVLGSIGLMHFQPLILSKQVPTAKIPHATQAQLRENYGKLPLYFIENHGQLDPRVGYYIQASNKTMYFTPEGVTYALTAPSTLPKNHSRGHSERSKEPAFREAPYKPDSFIRPASSDRIDVYTEPDPPKQPQRWVLKLDFVDANPNARPEGRERTESIVSYFKGPKEDWNTGPPSAAGSLLPRTN